MKNFLFIFLCVAALAIPVHAAPDGGVVDGTVATDAASELDPETPLESTPSSVALEEEASPLAVSGSLAGGYYFVADCALGSAVKFYVPLEWAHDVFTLDRSGAPVNLSNSTCYAYAPAFPDYTIQCSRFGTFTYRATNYSTSDLYITNISDTNIEFLEDETQRPSDSDVLLLIAALVFVFGTCFILIRR